MYGPAGAKRPGQVRMRLEVHTDPDNPVSADQTGGNSRLFYTAHLFLRDTASVPPVDTTWVGTIESYRIWKATATVPKPAGPAMLPWASQFLQVDNYPGDPDLIDMCLLLQCLFQPNGAPCQAAIAPLLTPALQAQLAGDSLVYIKLVYIRDTWQQQGLLTLLVNRYLDALKRLPECEFLESGGCNVIILTTCTIVYACGPATTLILQPANPGGIYGASHAAAGRSAAQAETLLQAIYANLGFAVLRVKQYLDPGTGLPDGPPVIAMGRRL